MGRLDEIEKRHVRAQGVQAPLSWCRACSEDWPCDSAYLVDKVKRLRQALKRSYWRDDLPSDKPVEYVGVYTLKWGRVDEPTVAFGRWEDEDIAAISEEGSEA